MKQGDLIEETAEVVNPEDRTHIAISLPLAAGFEPLNPNLATAPAEAQPSIAPTLPPTWVAFGDDRVFYAYDSLPKGTYRFAFRLRAQTAGAYTQPPALVADDVQEGPSRDERGRAGGDWEIACKLRELRAQPSPAWGEGGPAKRGRVRGSDISGLAETHGE